MLSNISRSKGSQKIKLGQLIEYNNSIFTQKSCRKWGKKISYRPLFVFSKYLICCKSNWSGAWFQYFLIALNLGYNKNKPYKTVDHWSSVVLTFDFLEKSLGIVSPPHFKYVFSRKRFSCYILLTDQISLSDCLYILRYRAICVL